MVEAIIALHMENRRSAPERITDKTMEGIDECIEGLPGKDRI